MGAHGSDSLTLIEIEMRRKKVQNSGCVQVHRGDRSMRTMKRSTVHWMVGGIQTNFISDLTINASKRVQRKNDRVIMYAVIGGIDGNNSSCRPYICAA
jgi:hypothetical protein